MRTPTALSDAAHKVRASPMDQSNRRPADNRTKDNRPTQERLSSQHRPLRAAGDRLRRRTRRTRPDRGSPGIADERRWVAVGNVRREHRGRADARLLRDAPTGAPTGVDPAPSTAGHGTMWRTHDVLDRADRVAEDGRSPRLWSCCRISTSERARRISSDLRLIRDGTPRKGDRVRAIG